MRRIFTLFIALTALTMCIRAQQIDSVVVYSLSDTITYRTLTQAPLAALDTIFPTNSGNLQLLLTRDAQQRPVELIVTEDSVPQERYRWFYSGNVTNIISHQVWANNKWRNRTRTEFNYDNQGRLIEQLQSEWHNVYWRPVSLWRNTYANAQLAEVSLNEPIYHDWRSTHDVSYDFSESVAAVTYTPGYWNDAYGLLRDSYIPLICNGHYYTFYGHKLEVYYQPDFTALPTVRVPNSMPEGVYDLMGRRVADRLDASLPHGIYLLISPTGAQKVMK